MSDHDASMSDCDDKQCMLWPMVDAACEHCIGLAHEVSIAYDVHKHVCTITKSSPSSPTAWIAPSLSPCKDMEVVVSAPPGTSLRCPAFHTAMYTVLRALIDRLGVQTYNLVVYNVPVGDCHDGGPLLARYGVRCAVLFAQLQ